MADIVEQDGTVKIRNVTVQGSGGSYAGAASFQDVAVDLTLAAGAGKTGNTAFLAPIMGNLLGAALTKLGNYLGGLIGHYNVTGAKQTTYPAGAVLAGIGDGVTAADGAVVPYIDGDSAQTNCGAMFKVRSNNSTRPAGGLQPRLAGRGTRRVPAGGRRLLQERPASARLRRCAAGRSGCAHRRRGRHRRRRRRPRGRSTSRRRRPSCTSTRTRRRREWTIAISLV